ncbi:hypothetical protein [Methylobacterium variabile]|jgi:hypothetical protein|uniref:hypothetical protein n=1 Tax=Methylobacterium variabile TaxID=298794 RepID=UPI000A6933F2|nr:hypothetical protein [Methylobacterium variabile]
MMRAVVVLGCAMLLGGCVSGRSREAEAQLCSRGFQALNDQSRTPEQRAALLETMRNAGCLGQQPARVAIDPPPFRIVPPGSSRLDCTTRNEFGQARTTCN